MSGKGLRKQVWRSLLEGIIHGILMYEGETWVWCGSDGLLAGEREFLGG